MRRVLPHSLYPLSNDGAVDSHTEVMSGREKYKIPQGSKRKVLVALSTLPSTVESTWDKTAEVKPIAPYGDETGC